MAAGVIVLLVSYMAMMVQFMLLSENVIRKSELINREIILFSVFIAGAAIVIRYRKEEGEKKAEA